jgi:hypothetical protein
MNQNTLMSEPLEQTAAPAQTALVTTPPTTSVNTSLTTTAAAAAAVQRTAPAAHAAAVQDTLKAPVLLGGWAARSATNGIDTARLLAFGVDAQTWGELFQMQQAIFQRLALQQQAWLQGWAGWNQQRAQMRAANTVTKLVEQECNLIAQIGQLLIDQTTNLVALQENVEVSYAYWLNQKLGALSSTPGVQTPVSTGAKA